MISDRIGTLQQQRCYKSIRDMTYHDDIWWGESSAYVEKSSHRQRLHLLPSPHQRPHRHSMGPALATLLKSHP